MPRSAACASAGTPRVVGFESRPRVAILASGEWIEADAVVLCCGRWSGEVAELAGLDVPMIGGEAGSLALGLLVLTGRPSRGFSASCSRTT